MTDKGTLPLFLEYGLVASVAVGVLILAGFGAYRLALLAIARLAGRRRPALIVRCPSCHAAISIDQGGKPR